MLLLSTKTFHTSPDVRSQPFPSSLVHSSFKKGGGNRSQSQRQKTNKPKTVVVYLRDSVAGIKLLDQKQLEEEERAYLTSQVIPYH